MQLTQQQLTQYQEDGFLIVPNLLTAAEVDRFVAYQRQAAAAGRGFPLRAHTEDDVWNSLARHRHTAGIVQQLLGAELRIVQTMYLPKAAAAPGNKPAVGIALHQDTHYLPSDPNTLTACWLALSDTDADNGGLCVVPGSHRRGLRTTHRNEDDEHVSWEHDQLLRDRDGKEWTVRMYSFQIDDLDESQVVRLTVPKGGGVFFTGMTIHGSYANHSAVRERLAWAVHYIGAQSWLLRADVQDCQPVGELVSSLT